MTMSSETFISPSLTTVTEILYQCLMCNKQYKRKAVHIQHQQVVASYNIIPSDCYVLPINATKEFKKTIMFMIKERLKLHFQSTGKQNIMFPCSKSQFFAVFEGYIHYFNLKRQEYKCIFRREAAYNTLA